jgi:hypothetical protein
MQKYNICYNFAKSIINELRDKGLLGDVKINLSRLKTFDMFYRRYFYNRENDLYYGEDRDINYEE